MLVATVLLATLLGMGSAGGAWPLAYSGAYSEVSYRYRTGADGGLTGFELETPAGALVGRIDAPGGYTRVVLADGASGTNLVMTQNPPVIAAQEDVHLASPETDEDFYFRARADGDGARLVAGNSPACEGLASDDVVSAVREAATLLSTEIDRHPAPPRHLVEVAATVLYTDALLQLAGCSTPAATEAAACYYDNSTFVACRGCCENDALGAGFICQLGTMSVCKGMMCKYLTAVGCGAFVEMLAGSCIAHNCRGKGGPGSPCSDPKPACPGQCMVFCGPGWSSTCGECPEGKECCS